MSVEDLEKAFKLTSENFNQNECYCSTPKSEELIREAEKILNVKFPRTYKNFIRKIGWGGPKGLLIPGIRVDDPAELSSTGLVWGVLKDRKDSGYPDHIIGLYDLGEGTTYCLDLSQMNKEGECPVVVWPLEGYEATPVLEILAEDFGKFYLDMIEEQIIWKRKKEDLDT